MSLVTFARGCRRLPGFILPESQKAGMATLKEIQLRLKSITNIAKITKSMKMIASTKVPRAQRALDASRAFANSARALPDTVSTEWKPESRPQELLIVVSSDRGLCGGIHSGLSRTVRKVVKADASNQGLNLVIIGDKARNQLQRDLRNSIRLSFNQVGKNGPTFEEASIIATKIAEIEGFEKMERITVVFNHFKSVIAYTPQMIPVPVKSTFQVESAPDILRYEFTDETIENLQEYLLASTIFMAMTENYASEVSARRSAMDNATKNAGDIIDRLTMSYNRQRQASITNDLVDIITGASAV